MSLSKIQAELKANKSQYNKFGNYNYRSLEDITEALKPLLLKYNAHFIITHEPFEMGGRIFDRATATITFNNKDGVESYSSTAYAEMITNAKGMSQPQMSGATQTYSGKYACGGLFAIDDNKDPDSIDNSTLVPQSKASDEDKKKLWNDFTEICNSLDVDAKEFLEYCGVDMTDKKAVHNTVVKWIKSGQMLQDQILIFKNA